MREFPFGQQYAGMLVIFSVMVVYSITCPLVTPFGESCNIPVLHFTQKNRMKKKKNILFFLFYEFLDCALISLLFISFLQGLLYLGLKHFVDRYNLYFNYRAPAYKYMDSGVHSLAVTYAMLSTFFLLLSLLFFSIIRLGELSFRGL